MSLPHLTSGQVVALASNAFGHDTKSVTLVKTAAIEVLRLVVPKDKEIASHKAPGEITVQCIEGRVAFDCHGATHELLPGDFLYLEAAEPHALLARDDSVLLVTILFTARKAAQ